MTSVQRTTVRIGTRQFQQAAGGRLLTDEHAPSFWVLADGEGNEACVCTAM